MREALHAADYDEQWSRLGDFVRYNPGARHRRRHMIGMIMDLPGKTLLDVECGPGELMITVAQERPELALTGVDLSPAVVESNRNNLPGMTFEVFDLESQTTPDRYDIVLCSEVIEHLNDWRVGIRNLSRMVKEGGYLALSVPTGRIHATEREFGHVEHPVPAELDATARHHRFESVSLRNWRFPAHRALKLATNISPGYALERFGDGDYSTSAKLLSNLLYGLTFLGIPSSRQGCQIFALFRLVAFR